MFAALDSHSGTTDPISSANAVSEQLKAPTNLTNNQGIVRNNHRDRLFEDFNEAVEDEFRGGKLEPGYARHIQERKAITERTHGAARDRDSIVELGDDAIYGDDRSEFRSALAREKLRNAREQDRRLSRIKELQRKDDDRQEAMLKMLRLPSTLAEGKKAEMRSQRNPF